MEDWYCHQCSGCQIPALAAAGGLADRTSAGPRGDTRLVSVQGTPAAPNLGGWGGTSSRAKDMPLLTDIRKQVLEPAVGAPILNEGQPSASKRHAGSRPVGGGSWGNQDGGDISSAVLGKQTDPIGAVHLSPSLGAAAAPNPAGWEGQQLRLPEMKPTTGEKGKRKLETSLDPFSLPDGQIPAQKRHAGTRHAGGDLQPLGGGGGASGAAVTKDRPLLQRDQESPDYDMPDSIDNDLTTHPSKTRHGTKARRKPAKKQASHTAQYRSKFV